MVSGMLARTHACLQRCLERYVRCALAACFERIVHCITCVFTALCVVCLHSALQVAKFVAFVAGSFAALLLGLSFLDENLLEVPMAGRNLVWWLALTGILLTIRWG